MQTTVALLFWPVTGVLFAFETLALFRLHASRRWFLFAMAVSFGFANALIEVIRDHQHPATSLMEIMGGNGTTTDVAGLLLRAALTLTGVLTYYLTARRLSVTLVPTMWRNGNARSL